MRRFSVIRCPSSGPCALVGAPNDFATKDAAEARIAEIEQDHRKSHHTFLAIVPYEGPKAQALLAQGNLV